MAVSGESFCTSAFNGFLLNLKYGAKFYYAQKLASLFIGLGILGVALLTTGFSMVSFKYIFKEAEGMSSLGYVVPICAFMTISLVTVIIFLGLFDESVLACTICYSIDTDLHDGRTEFGPPTFHEKLDDLYGYDGENRYTSMTVIN